MHAGETHGDSMPALAAKLAPLKTSLTAALLQSLSLPSNRKSHIVQLIGLLSRLKAGAAARSTFLAARADMMRKRVRTITFEGDITTYISDLATVVFTGIKHTADWFLASFKENEAASCEFSHEVLQLVFNTNAKYSFCGVGEDADGEMCGDVQETSLQLRRRS